MRFSLQTVITAFTVLLISSTLQQTAYEPQMIVELWRHGARAAARDTYDQDYVKKYGPGNIVGNGMRMHYNLGRAVKKMYEDSIFKDMKYTDFKVYATSIQRTILSAYSHMMGIFPAGTGPSTSNSIDETKLPPFDGATDDKTIGDGALPYQINPVPIVTFREIEDDYFMKGMEIKCPEADKKKDLIFEENVKNKPNVFDKITPVVEKAFPCKQFFGKEKYDLKTLGIFSDINKCYYYNEGKAMAGTESVMDKMKYVFGIYYINAKYTNDGIKKLYTSKMSQDIIKNFEDKIAGTNKLKFLGLSGHETNVVPYMMGYGLTSEECLIKKLNDEPVTGICEGSPEFAANFIWELSKKEGKYFVRVLYNGKPILGCLKDKALEGNYCPFEDFKTTMRAEFILSDDEYKKACGSTGNNTNTVENKSIWGGWKWLALVLMMVSIALLVGLCFFMSKGKDEERMKPDLTGDESYSKL